MSKKDSLLSFVIPVYKKPPEVFDKCLRSLYDMSYKQIEVICVFDGADPELQKVASNYKTKEVVIEHGGAPKARNAGFKHTSGEYVSFWDADCYAKPEMARMWIETFKANPEADFVYSGYEFVDQQGGIPGEPFDPYSLTCGNYIATMFPMKRGVFPGFDESLKAAQDWDLWLTIVEKGGKGLWLEGYGFITEVPDRESISGKGWSDEKYAETVRTIKEKHGIPQREIVVGSAMHKIKGLHVAKLLGADFVQFPSWRPHQYKLVLNLGFGEDIRFRNAPNDCVKLQYWMPWDIDGLEGIPYKSAVGTIRNALKEVDAHLCNEIVSQKRLKNLGIEEGKGIPAQIVPLPTEIDDLETSLPREFKVLLDIHDQYKPVFKSIKQDLPYITMDELDSAADVRGYSLLLSFYPHPTVDEAIRRCLLNGRHVISNVQAPYCGFIDLEVGFGQFKDSIINAIREVRLKPFNSDGQAHYKKSVDPSKFKDTIMRLWREHAKTAEEVAA
jgi:glycosyltransferase involved in cell wall biosynthesis